VSKASTNCIICLFLLFVIFSNAGNAFPSVLDVSCDYSEDKLDNISIDVYQISALEYTKTHWGEEFYPEEEYFSDEGDEDEDN